MDQNNQRVTDVIAKPANGRTIPHTEALLPLLVLRNKLIENAKLQ